jgi:hypothetical protein
VFCTLLAFILAIAVKGEDLMSTFGASYDVCTNRTRPFLIQLLTSPLLVDAQFCFVLTLFNALMLIATLVILKYLKPTRKPPSAPLTWAEHFSPCLLDAVLLCSAPCGWRSSFAAEPARAVRTAFSAPGKPALCCLVYVLLPAGQLLCGC